MLSFTSRAVSEGSWVEVEVTDTGTGIRNEDVPRLFRLGFTTRRGQGGHGLGLYGTKRLLEHNLGGQLTLGDHRVGHGTTFLIRIPNKAYNARAHGEMINID